MNPTYRVLQVFFPFAAAYFLSYVMRTANAVLSAPLTEEFGLSASDLGLLSSAYFLTFAAMQIPLGSLLDRRGPRNIELFLLIFAIAGCLISSMATGFISLWIGRALIGIGVSACLMAAYKAFRQCFSAHQQPSLASLMLMVGSIGSLAATVPIEWMLPVLGWRGVFLLTALLFAISAALLFWLLPRLPDLQPVNTPYWRDTISGAKAIFGHREYSRFFPFAIFVHGGFLAVQSLWIGPWLRSVDGLNSADAAGAIFILGVIVITAHMLMSWAATRFAQWGWPIDRVLFAGSCLMVIATFGAITNVFADTRLSWGLLFLSTGITGLIYAKFGLTFPVSMAGRANTTINFTAFIGAFAMQWGIGLLIDLFSFLGLSNSSSYRAAFFTWAFTQVFAVFWMWFKGPRRGRSRDAIQSPRSGDQS